MTSEASVPKKILLKPIIISNKKMIIKSPKLMTTQQYKEEVIYSSPSCDFLKGESQEVVIVNRLNLLKKSCRTIARCTSRGIAVDTTSDNVSAVLGQKNYETVLSALSSVFNEETKVRGILALLSVPKKLNTVATQTDIEVTKVKKDLVHMGSQTFDSQLNMFVKEKQRKRIRRQPLTPYVVTDKLCKVKKIVINIDDVKKELKMNKKEVVATPNLPDLKLVVDEDSNMSCGSVGSLSSLPSVPGVLDNANALLKEIDKVTDKTLNSTEIQLLDGSHVMIPVKPEDMFHVATPEILKNVTHEERVKLICHQAYIDFKMCLQQDEDGYYPLHVAVLNNDADLVRRLCAAMRARHESVDIPVSGLTALQMSVRQNASVACTEILLQNGADPLVCDHERRCSLHLAAETDSNQLKCLLAYCDTNARSVLKNNMDFWRPEHEAKTDEQLKSYLYHCVSEMFDEQGYTPLMIAVESAISSHVTLLAARAGSLIDVASPNCGATALYRLVAKACLHAKETNSIVTPEKYLKAIEILVEHGADPSVENHAGSSVNTLLTEFNISTLSMTIANKMTAMRHGPYANDKLNMILYKHNDGRIGFKDINNVTNKKDTTDRVKPHGLHAIITVDIPTKDTKNTKNFEKISNDTGQNTKSAKVENSSYIIVRNSSGEILNASDMDKLSSSQHILSDKSVKLKEASASRLSDAIKNVINETISLKEKNYLKDVSENAKHQQIEFNNVVLNQANVDVGGKIVTMRAPGVKLSVKEAKAGNLGNVTLKRLKSGQMIAITKANTDKTDNKKMKLADFLGLERGVAPKVNYNIIKVKQPYTVAPKSDNQANYKTDLNKTEVPKDEKSRSAKERKTDNVVIVENVPLNKGFAISNILKPGTSKIAKPRDIVISPPKVTIQDDDSPEIVVNDDVETVNRKRKLRSQ